MDNYIKVIARPASILSKEALGVSLIDCTLQLQLLVPELASHVDVGGLGPHAEADNKRALDKLVRIVSQDLAIFASSWLRFVRIDNKVGWSEQKLKPILKLDPIMWP